MVVFTFPSNSFELNTIENNYGRLKIEKLFKYLNSKEFRGIIIEETNNI